MENANFQTATLKQVKNKYDLEWKLQPLLQIKDTTNKQ